MVQVHSGAAAKLGWRRRPACLDGLPIRAVIKRSAHQTRRNIYVGGRKGPVRRWKGEFDGESREAERHASMLATAVQIGRASGQVRKPYFAPRRGNG